MNRKYRLANISLGLITAYGVFAAYRLAAQGLYPAFIGGVLAVLGFYAGANVMQKRVQGGGEK